MELRKKLFLLLALLAVSACSRFNLLPTATPLPLPVELATTPPPDGSQPGGLEGIFVSAVSVDGAQDSRCYKLYRFYPDGLALYSNFACLDFPPVTDHWADIDSWFRQENRDVTRGDYFTLGQRVWIRIVASDPIHEVIELRSFQGELCENAMVLQEPAVRYYAGVPSQLTQPVLEYVRLAAPARNTGAPTDGANPTHTADEICHVAGFEILRRPSIVLAGGQAEYLIRTHAEERCTLQYITPNGVLTQAEGTGTINADAQGICHWIWGVGDDAGNATVTVSIDEITQDFDLDVR